MSALRFALVGCGGIARHHLKALGGCAHPTQVAAVVDERRDNAVELAKLIPPDQTPAENCQVFSSLQDLLSWGRFDAAILMVPHYLHTEYAQACLRGNKHVLVEKPLAHNLKSALVLLEEVEKSKTVFMVGEQSPHWPEHYEKLVKHKQLELQLSEAKMAQQMVSAAEEKENSLAEKQYLLAETLEQQKRCEVLTQQETELVHGKLMVKKAQELLVAGTVGRPFHALANYWEGVGYTTFLDEAHFFAGGNWRFDPQKAGGGVLMDGATHWVRPLTTWLGEVEEVVGMVDYPLKQSRCETLAHSLLKFSSGVSASLYCHFNTIPMTKLPFFQIFGDKGEITIGGSFDGGMEYRNTSHPEGVDLGSLGGFSVAFAPQMQEFVGQIASGQHKPRDAASESSAQQALREVMVAEATYKSVRTRQWERVTLENLT